MLKTLTPLHTPELLHALASMGHGDEIAIVDCNFPAVSMGQRIIRLDGTDLVSALEACLQLMPIDNFVKDVVFRMQQVHAPEEIPEVQKDCQAVIDKAEGKHVAMTGISREAFYEQAKKAFAVVVTGENRPYGCILVKKGVVFPATRAGHRAEENGRDRAAANAEGESAAYSLPAGANGDSGHNRRR